MRRAEYLKCQWILRVTIPTIASDQCSCGGRLKRFIDQSFGTLEELNVQTRAYPMR